MTRTKLLSLLLLAALLLSCGPDTQEDPTTALSQEEQNVYDSGVIPAEAAEESSERVAAAKARRPHQYKDRPPLNLFDVGTNLNPASNR